MYYIYVQICLAAGTEAMGKYSALGDYLRAQTRSEVPMTFAQIERVIGAKLPQSHKYRAWWSNNAFNSVMTKTWLEAGYRTERVDMAGRKLDGNRDQLSHDVGDQLGHDHNAREGLFIRVRRRRADAA